MDTNEIYMNLEGSLLLKDKGFDWPCRYMYADYTRVADEITEKHPGLSDDGYMDLMKEYGGIYDREQVYKTYKEPVQRYCRNTPEFLNSEWNCMICAMPTTAQARTWLRNIHHIDIVIYPIDEGYKSEVIIPDKEDETGLTRISLRVNRPDNGTEFFREYAETEMAAIIRATEFI